MTRKSHRHIILVSSLLWATLGFSSCASTAPLPSVQQLIERHIAARGGRDALSAVKTRRLAYEETNADGQTLEEEISSKAPNQEFVVVREKGGRELFRTMFNGVMGYEMVQGVPQNLAQKEASQLGVDSEMFPELRFDLLFPTSKVTGKQTWHNRPAYRVEATSSAGYQQIFYFDSETSLLIGIEYPSVPSAHFLEAFEDYGGVKYARTEQLELGGKPSTRKLISIEHNLDIPDTTFRMR